jgi:VIT1/CCC1 family predicted Fe2+/Mn2+ transporter
VPCALGKGERLAPSTGGSDRGDIGTAEQHPHGGGWLRDVVLGLNDGLVTTLVFVMTLGGATGSRHVLLTSAFAELVAGGVSMGCGGFLAARADADILAARIATERQEIATEPEEERRELRAIYRRKGFRGGLLEAIIAHQTATPERWLAAMLHDEHGITPEQGSSPLQAGTVVGLSFVAGALVPILPFLIPWPRLPAALASFALAAAAAMGLGALKSRHTLRGALRSGVEFLTLAAAAALVGGAAGQVIGHTG